MNSVVVATPPQMYPACQLAIFFKFALPSPLAEVYEVLTRTSKTCAPMSEVCHVCTGKLLMGSLPERAHNAGVTNEVLKALLMFTPTSGAGPGE